MPLAAATPNRKKLETNAGGPDADRPVVGRRFGCMDMHVCMCMQMHNMCMQRSGHRRAIAPLWLSRPGRSTSRSYRQPSSSTVALAWLPSLRESSSSPSACIAARSVGSSSSNRPERASSSLLSPLPSARRSSDAAARARGRTSPNEKVTSAASTRSKSPAPAPPSLLSSPNPAGPASGAKAKDAAARPRSRQPADPVPSAASEVASSVSPPAIRANCRASRQSKQAHLVTAAKPFLAALAARRGKRSASPSVRRTKDAPRSAHTRPGAPAPAPSSITLAPRQRLGLSRRSSARATAAGQTRAPPITSWLRSVSPQLSNVLVDAAAGGMSGEHFSGEH
mmetsp:Transcript_16257/g.52120  ORF Transcript_16257/g.52120 Transcript_16257/m.52120 type:complete len:338 (+) Transcript_16257:39-1052(+)